LPSLPPLQAYNAWLATAGTRPMCGALSCQNDPIDPFQVMVKV